MLKVIFPVLLLALPFQVALSRPPRLVKKAYRLVKAQPQPGRVEFVAEVLAEESLPVAFILVNEAPANGSASWDDLPANQTQALF